MEINSRVVILREALTRLIPLLTNKQVQVTMRGMKAFVEFHPVTHLPIRVNIPYLPDDASDELIDAVQGFLDHEVGHILFSDPTCIAKANALGEEYGFMHNAIEDPYVEKMMQERFTGSAYNLANTGRFFLRRMVKPTLDKAKLMGDTANVQAQLVVPVIRAHAGQPDFEEFIDGYRDEVRPLEENIGADLLARIKDCRSSEDCLNLAIEIQKRLEEEKEKQDKSKKGEPKEGKGSSKSKSKPKSGEDQKGESDPASGEGGPEEGKSSDQDGESEVKEGEGEDPGDNGSVSPRSVHKIPDGFFAAVRKTKGYDDSLSEIITEQAIQESKDSDYLVFTRDDDKIAPIVPRKQDIDKIPEMQAKVDSMIGPLQKDLERAIAARSAIVFVGGQKRGRINSSALHTLHMGRVDVFKKKEVNKTKNVAVQIIVDCSGSMTTHQKIVTASFSAYAMASMLDRLNIKCEVIGFTTRGMSAQVHADLRKDPSHMKYARFEALNLLVFKEFDERVDTEVRGRFVNITDAEGVCASNVDGESIMLASRRLHARREARKIVLVLSDGHPAVYGGHADLHGHLKAVVRSIEASGIDIVGIGIKDRAPAQFYKKHVIMQQVSDLPAIVTGQLKKLLLQ